MVRKVYCIVSASLLRLMRMMRSQERVAIYRAAILHARLDCDDESAKARLAEEIAPHRRGRDAALRMLRRGRGEFLSDRAFRLLYAATHDLPVEPRCRQMEELFGREARLGRLPVATAYAQLVEMEPRLGDPELSHRGSSETATNATPAGMRLSMFLGPNAQHPDPLVRSQLALSIAAQYQAVLRGDLGEGAENASYFAATRKMVLRSGTLIRGQGQSSTQ
jgi:hypothetical protein